MPPLDAATADDDWLVPDKPVRKAVSPPSFELIRDPPASKTKAAPADDDWLVPDQPAAKAQPAAATQPVQPGVSAGNAAMPPLDELGLLQIDPKTGAPPGQQPLRLAEPGQPVQPNALRDFILGAPGTQYPDVFGRKVLDRAADRIIGAPNAIADTPDLLNKLRQEIAPDPNTIYGSPIDGNLPMGANPLGAMFSPFARDATTGDTRFTLPPLARSLGLGALDILQGRVMVDPADPVYGIRPTPDTTAVLGLGARPLRFGEGASPAPMPPPGSKPRTEPPPVGGGPGAPKGAAAELDDTWAEFKKERGYDPRTEDPLKRLSAPPEPPEPLVRDEPVKAAKGKKGTKAADKAGEPASLQYGDKVTVINPELGGEVSGTVFAVRDDGKVWVEHYGEKLPRLYQRDPVTDRLNLIGQAWKPTPKGQTASEKPNTPVLKSEAKAGHRVTFAYKDGDDPVTGTLIGVKQVAGGDTFVIDMGDGRAYQNVLPDQVLQVRTPPAEVTPPASENAGQAASGDTAGLRSEATGAGDPAATTTAPATPAGTHDWSFDADGNPTLTVDGRTFRVDRSKLSDHLIATDPESGDVVAADTDKNALIAKLRRKFGSDPAVAPSSEATGGGAADTGTKATEAVRRQDAKTASAETGGAPTLVRPVIQIQAEDGVGLGTAVQTHEAEKVAAEEAVTSNEQPSPDEPDLAGAHEGPWEAAGTNAEGETVYRNPKGRRATFDAGVPWLGAPDGSDDDNERLKVVKPAKGKGEQPAPEVPQPRPVSQIQAEDGVGLGAAVQTHQDETEAAQKAEQAAGEPEAEQTGIDQTPDQAGSDKRPQWLDDRFPAYGTWSDAVAAFHAFDATYQKINAGHRRGEVPEAEYLEAKQKRDELVENLRDAEAAKEAEFSWKTAKVGDILPRNGHVIVGKRMDRKAAAVALAKETGGYVSLDGPKHWAVLAPAGNPAPKSDKPAPKSDGAEDPAETAADKPAAKPAAAKPAPSGPAMAPVGDDYFPPVQSGQKLRTQSGREITVPTFSGGSNRADNVARAKLNAWLLDEARKEVAATNNDWQTGLLRGANARNFSQSDRDMASDILFGPDGPKAPAKEAEKAEKPAATPPPKATNADVPTLLEPGEKSFTSDDIGTKVRPKPGSGLHPVKNAGTVSHVQSSSRGPMISVNGGPHFNGSDFERVPQEAEKPEPTAETKPEASKYGPEETKFRNRLNVVGSGTHEGVWKLRPDPVFRGGYRVQHELSGNTTDHRAPLGEATWTRDQAMDAAAELADKLRPFDAKPSAAPSSPVAQPPAPPVAPPVAQTGKRPVSANEHDYLKGNVKAATDMLERGQRGKNTTPEELTRLEQRRADAQAALDAVQPPPTADFKPGETPQAGEARWKAEKARHDQAVAKAEHDEGHVPAPNPNVFPGLTPPGTRGARGHDSAGREWFGTPHALVAVSADPLFPGIMKRAEKRKTEGSPVTVTVTAIDKVTNADGADAPITWMRTTPSRPPSLEYTVGQTPNGRFVALQTKYFDLLSRAAGPDGSMTTTEEAPGKDSNMKPVFARKADGQVVGIAMPVRVPAGDAAIWALGLADAEAEPAASEEPSDTAGETQRRLDIKGNPIFKQGERIVIAEPKDFAGRHGVVTKAIGMVMSPIGGKPSPPSYSYELKTDAGMLTWASKLEAETGEPPEVVPDPVSNGHAIDAVSLKRHIDYAQKSERNFIAAEQRARTQSKKASHRKAAAASKAEAAAKQADLDTWKAAHPEEAAKLFPAAPAAPAGAPPATAPVTPGEGVRMVETKHTKTGQPLWVVIHPRVPNDQYAALLASAKQNGGKYSSYRGNGAIPGFTFPTKAGADGFMRDQSGKPAASEPAEPTPDPMPEPPAAPPAAVSPPAVITPEALHDRIIAQLQADTNLQAVLSNAEESPDGARETVRKAYRAAFGQILAEADAPGLNALAAAADAVHDRPIGMDDVRAITSARWTPDPAPPPAPTATTAGKSWAPEFEIDRKWSGNAMRFATKAEAEAYGFNKLLNWNMPTDSRAVELDDPANYRWDNETGLAPIKAPEAAAPPPAPAAPKDEPFDPIMNDLAMMLGPRPPRPAAAPAPSTTTLRPTGLKDTHQGVWYFDTERAAEDYATKVGVSPDRVIEYTRGFAIQDGVSGPYVGPDYPPQLPSPGETTISVNQESDDGIQDPLPLGNAPKSAGDVQPTPPLGEDGRTPSGEEPGSPRDADGDAASGTKGRTRGSGDAGSEGGGGDREGDADRLPDTGQGRPPRAAGRPAKAVSGDVKGLNFSIAPGELDTLEGRGWGVKARDNVTAIALAKQLKAEGRPATRDEQEVLVKYVGWGGMKNAFRDSQHNFGKGMEAIGAQIEKLLTPEEYRTASKSTQYAHYTAEHIVRTMWDAVEQMGFTGGSVFEPGMGIGHFLGAMPPDLAELSPYRGIEMDHLTADIAKLLYPQSAIRQADYTRMALPEKAFDLVIGNPPFSAVSITSDRRYAANKFALHDFFFAKSLDAVRPGGLLAFITSAGTMNKMTADGREYLAERGEFLGGIRLPAGAFRRNARTDVTTDILFFKRRMEGKVAIPEGEMPDWTKVVVRDLPNRDGEIVPGNVSRYFSEHPENVLGEEGFFDQLVAGEARYAVRARPESDLQADLRAAIERLPHDVMEDEASPEVRAQLDFSSTEKKDGSFYLADDGALMQYSNGAGRPVQARGAGVKGGLTTDDRDRIIKLIPVRDALREVFAADLARDDAAGAAARKKLNQTYDTFVKWFGPINKAEISFKRPNVIQQERARAEAREDARYAGQHFDEGDFDPSEMIAAQKAHAADDEDDGDDTETAAPKGKWAAIARARQAARVAALEFGKGFNEGEFDPADMPDVVIDKRPNIRPFMADPESYRLRSIEFMTTHPAKPRRSRYSRDRSSSTTRNRSLIRRRTACCGH